VGSVIPIAVSLATVPVYLRLIGDVRFGVLAIAWVFLGYFAVFEIGLGRAVSKYIAELRDAPAASREAAFSTAAILNLLMGVAGGALLWGVASWTMPWWLQNDAGIREEVVRALPWLGAAVPVATLTSVMVGALEGRERFDIINMQEVGATLLFQLVPLGIAYAFGPRVDWLIAAAVLVRVAGNLTLLSCCIRCVPLSGWPRLDRRWLRRLLSYGAWIALTGIIGPVLDGLDRFVIGIALGAQTLAYYSIAYNFATRLRFIPLALWRALFPRLSGQSSSEARLLAVRGTMALAAILTPMIVVALVATAPFFEIWLGPTVAERCTTAGELLLLGVWFSSLAGMPYAMLQAQGRPDVAPKLQALLLVPFLGALWIGIHLAGLAGAAAAWGARCAVGGTLIAATAGILRPVSLRLLPSLLLLGLALVTSWLVENNVPARIAAVVLLGSASLLAAHVMSPDVTRAAARGVRGSWRRTHAAFIPRG
jgi:O-antigen/teichoic acid export membrane protein